MNAYRKAPTLIAAATTVMLAAGALHAVDAAAARTAADPDVRRVEIEVTARGFVPAKIEVRAGAPVDLVFTRTTASGCTSHVHIPTLGVERTALPRSEPVTIRIAPERPGTYEYLCGMNMLRGTIRVTSEA